MPHIHTGHCRSAGPAPRPPAPPAQERAFGGITSKSASIVSLNAGSREVLGLDIPLPGRLLTITPGAITTTTAGIYKLYYELPLISDYFIFLDENNATVEAGAANDDDLIRQKLTQARESGINMGGLLDVLAHVRAGIMLNGAVLQDTTSGIYTNSCANYGGNGTLFATTLAELPANAVLNLAIWSNNTCSTEGDYFLLLPGAKLMAEQM